MYVAHLMEFGLPEGQDGVWPREDRRRRQPVGEPRGHVAGERVDAQVPLRLLFVLLLLRRWLRRRRQAEHLHPCMGRVDHSPCY